MAANTRKTILASAARTASVDTADQVNAYHRGARIHIDATAFSATPSVVFTVQGKTASGDYYTVLASAAVTTSGDTYLYINNGATAAANAAANLPLPPVWRVSAVAGDADSLTYSIGVELFI